MSKKKQEIIPSNPTKAAVTGFLFSVPFVLINFIVSLKIQPFYMLIDSVPFLRESPFLPMFLLILFPIGAFISIRPLLKPGAKSKKMLFNVAVALNMFAIFLLIAYALGSEFVNCQILAIPNCD